MFHTCRRGPVLAAAPLLLFLSGGCREQPLGRTLPEIVAEREKLPTLYIVPETGEQLEVAGSAGAVVVPRTGKLAYRVWYCRNPDCPARKRAEQARTPVERVRFCWQDPLYYAKPDGSVEYEVVADRAAEIRRRGGTPVPICPQCDRAFHLSKAAPEIQRKYAQYCLEYVLPETSRRRRELYEELTRRVAWEKAHGTKAK